MTELEEVGGGGFGTVYRGYQPNFARHVAVKVLHKAVSHETSRRLSREAQAMGRASGHPNVLEVHAAGETPDGRLYLITPWVGGGSLADRLEHGPQAWTVVRTWAPQVCDALDHVHRAGLHHRDIKPANILFDDRDRPLLADFGIARALEDPTTTTDGAVRATLTYAAPELLDGAPASVESDVYALGVTLYHALVGTPPFTADSVPALLKRIAFDPPAPEPLVARCPPAVAELVLASMAKDPARRPPSAAHLGQVLTSGEPLLADAGNAANGPQPRHADLHQAHPGQPDDRPRRRVRAAIVAALAAVTLLIAAVALVLTQEGGEEAGADLVVGQEPVDDAVREVLAVIDSMERLRAAEPALSAALAENAHQLADAVNADRWDDAQQVVIDMVEQVRTGIESVTIDPLLVTALLDALRTATAEISAAR